MICDVCARDRDKPEKPYCQYESPGKQTKGLSSALSSFGARQAPSVRVESLGGFRIPPLGFRV
jgi:hypothetical protein